MNYVEGKVNSIKSKMEIKGYNLLVDLVKSKFGYSVNIGKSSGPNRYDCAMKFIKKYDKNYDKHIVNSSSAYDAMGDNEYIIKLRNDTFMYVATGTFAAADVFKMPDSNINIYIFGKKSYKYYKELLRMLDECKNALNMYSVSGVKDNNGQSGYLSVLSDMEPRNLSTLFYEDHVKTSIVEHIDSFLKNKPIYANRSLLYKTGIIFFGEPGTGKTSLAKAIASNYGFDLIVINMTTFNNIDTASLTSSITSDKKMYVVLLEDIDTMFDSLDREDKDIKRDDKDTINKLLQFLDSNNSPTNVIFIATTNYPEKLDAALLRSGRFDIKVEVKGIGLVKAKEMCKSFDLDDDETNKIVAGIDKFPVNQSYLQNKILELIKEKNKKEL